MVVIGQIAGALAAGVLANAIGRKKSMVLIALSYAVFALLGALSVSLPMLLTARFLLGLAIGVMVVVVPVYVAESAPAAVRGALLTTYQLTTSPGSSLATSRATCWPIRTAGGGCWGWPPRPQHCCCRC